VLQQKRKLPADQQRLLNLYLAPEDGDRDSLVSFAEFLTQRAETSSLMTAHIMRGRPAPDVIDDLEALFERYYRDHSSSKD
jgi:hypothetical protein